MSARFSLIIDEESANGSLSLPEGLVVTVRSTLLFAEARAVTESERAALVQVLERVQLMVLQMVLEVGMIPTERREVERDDSN